MRERADRSTSRRLAMRYRPSQSPLADARDRPTDSECTRAAHFVFARQLLDLPHDLGDAEVILGHVLGELLGGQVLEVALDVTPDSPPGNAPRIPGTRNRSNSRSRSSRSTCDTTADAAASRGPVHLAVLDQVDHEQAAGEDGVVVRAEDPVVDVFNPSHDADDARLIVQPPEQRPTTPAAAGEGRGEGDRNLAVAETSASSGVMFHSAAGRWPDMKSVG